MNSIVPQTILCQQASYLTITKSPKTFEGCIPLPYHPVITTATGKSPTHPRRLPHHHPRFLPVGGYGLLSLELLDLSLGLPELVVSSSSSLQGSSLPHEVQCVFCAWLFEQFRLNQHARTNIRDGISPPSAEADTHAVIGRSLAVAPASWHALGCRPTF
jgi:hypothetical protein